MFSRAVGREEHCKQISLACVGSARSVSATLGSAPAHSVCAFPVYTAQAAGCYAGSMPRVALPRSKLLRFKFSGTPQRRRLGWACILCRTPVPALVSGHARLWYAVCVFWVADLWLRPSSGCQPSRISGSLWLETGSLFAVR